MSYEKKVIPRIPGSLTVTDLRNSVTKKQQKLLQEKDVEEKGTKKNPFIQNIEVCGWGTVPIGTDKKA